MSFKTILLTILLFFNLSACGVKSDPVPPKGTALPSYVDKFLETDKDKKNDEKNSKEKRRE